MESNNNLKTCLKIEKEKHFETTKFNVFSILQIQKRINQTTYRCQIN